MARGSVSLDQDRNRRKDRNLKKRKTNWKAIWDITFTRFSELQLWKKEGNCVVISLIKYNRK